jgi:hypothetical protein
MRLRASISTIAAFLSVTIIADVASAACTRLSFSVNDYGKDGPTRDAKALLDTYIAKWTAERGIKKYTTGKKDVSCELYLNLLVVDEHTCKAEASVCWDGPKVPVTASTPQAGGKAKPTSSGALPAKAKSSSAAQPATSAVTTGAIPAPAAPAPASAAPTSTPAEAAPVSIPAADAPKKAE